MKYTNWLAQAGSLAELKKLYHQLARQHHPDLGGDTEIMQQINAEYRVREKIFQAGFDPYAPPASAGPAKPNINSRPAPTTKKNQPNRAKGAKEWQRLNWQAYLEVQQLREKMAYPGGLVAEIVEGRV